MSRKPSSKDQKNAKGVRRVRSDVSTPQSSASSSSPLTSSLEEDLGDEGNHREQMQRFDQMFQAPFMGLSRGFGGGPLAVEDSQHRHGQHRSSNRRQQHEQRAQNMQVSRQQQFMDPFAHFDSMFSNMRSMMSDMHRAFDQVSTDPNAHVYQQSTYISSSHMNGGAPKVFEATSSTRQIPGGVKETRKAVRDSETGVERVAMGHHINDRAHIIERSRNARTGESNENQELINLDEEEAPTFDQEYQDRWRSTMRGVEQRRRRIRELTHKPSQSHRALPEPETNLRRPRKTSHRKD